MGLVLGPLCFVIILLSPGPATLSMEAREVAAVAVLMALWWMTEAIPIPVTALLPVVLFPGLGVMESSAVTTNYANHLIYLFLGGFWIAVTIEKWNLHRRIALHIIRRVGTRSDRIVLGFMLATAWLSMWLSNTATAMMMLPIAMAVVNAEGQQSGPMSSAESRFATALMLGIAYAASVGGVATLIGTPPNAVFAGVVDRLYGERISFGGWFVFALPLALTMLVLTWLYLTRVALKSALQDLALSADRIDVQLRDLGPASKQERRVLAVFLIVAAAWIVNGLVDVDGLKHVHDSTIAIAGAVVLFLIPSDLRRGEFLLDWRTAIDIPWDVILLFGGGFALAHGFEQSGLTLWIGDQLAFLEGLNGTLVVLGVAGVTILLTELTSNTATVSMLLPIVACLAAGAGLDPHGPMVACTLAASFAFMLPVATPPNAIVYASRRVTIPQMVRVGFWLNLLGLVLIVLFVTVLLPRTWSPILP